MDRKAHLQWREKEQQDEKADEQFRGDCLRDLASAIHKGDVADGQVIIDLDEHNRAIGQWYKGANTLRSWDTIPVRCKQCYCIKYSSISRVYIVFRKVSVSLAC